jgi:hypothetical protein
VKPAKVEDAKRVARAFEAIAAGRRSSLTGDGATASATAEAAMAAEAA